MRQAQYRVQGLVLEASVRGYIPTIMAQESSRVLLEDMEDVQEQSQRLFEECPAGCMTVESSQLEELNDSVCGHPYYFKTILFERIRVDSLHRNSLPYTELTKVRPPCCYPLPCAASPTSSLSSSRCACFPSANPTRTQSSR